MREDIDTIAVIEKGLSVDKKQIYDGSVEVRTRTDHVEERFEIKLDRQQINVQRVPFGIIVDIAPEVRVEGNLTIIPVLEERVVVEKRLVLVEEIHIRKATISETEHVSAVVRKQRLTVDRTET